MYVVSDTSNKYMQLKEKTTVCTHGPQIKQQDHRPGYQVCTADTYTTWFAHSYRWERGGGGEIEGEEERFKRFIWLRERERGGRFKRFIWVRERERERERERAGERKREAIRQYKLSFQTIIPQPQLRLTGTAVAVIQLTLLNSLNLKQNWAPTWQTPKWGLQV